MTSAYEALLGDLGSFVDGIDLLALDVKTNDAIYWVLFDSLAVMVAGGRLEESRRLREEAPCAEGPATVFGAQVGYGVFDAAFLNGFSMVSLELDEGNKRIRGHASAHVLPAVLALAEVRGITGREAVSAFVAGHEVASRFGAATHLRKGVHPHGNWGVTGAAAAVARLLGGTPNEIAAAIDASATMAMATPFDAATEGVSIRNAWIGAANHSGLWSGILATSSGDARVRGLACRSLGEILGEVDPREMEGSPDGRLYVTSGYFKRHASCSYTHPPADLALSMHAELGGRSIDQIVSIEVRTHSLAAPLSATSWPTRLAAMFSIPYVTAVALLRGSCRPSDFSEATRSDPEVGALARRVSVVHDPDLDRELPAHRVAVLRVEFDDGEVLEARADNPIGDADYQPLGGDELTLKAINLLGEELADAVRRATDAVVGSATVSEVLGELRMASVQSPLTRERRVPDLHSRAGR